MITQGLVFGDVEAGGKGTPVGATIDLLERFADEWDRHPKRQHDGDNDTYAQSQAKLNVSQY
jgi:hypothetical protein